jgi:O-glycosyl hydrolase
MTNKELNKLLEIQYLKGRLDELYKSYQPGNPSHTNRIVDARISKYENKLKALDEIAFHLYQVERENQRFSKSKSKQKMKELFETILPKIKDNKLKSEIEEQIKSYN